VGASENKTSVEPERLARAPAVLQNAPQLCGPNANARDTRTAATPSRIWWWFVAILVLQAAAWTTWLVFASHHPVEEVPLARG
jgi:hypothetical protein